MVNYITYNNNKIEYTLIISKRKTSCIQVKKGSIIIKTNNYTPKKIIEEFLLKNINKVLTILENQKNNMYKNGSIIKIFGKDFTLNILDNEIDFPYTSGNTFNIYLDKKDTNINEKIEEILDKYYLYILKPYAMQSFENFKNKTSLYPNKIYFKKMKTRWGSCSSKKNISINILLAKYDKSVIDYVILHELCHLKEMNHSYSFWHLVEKYMPNYKEIKKILNNY
ncbi:SprT family zinc-dependent metalloprotease [uncultured Tyzzerella sp.]|uniref:M48 family metallopeptidase n=1 Tax=uncultured Tyzzerella sp. TaxID=2321398 RepID=UPI0029431369|nr:SprT family zinc-dependent metalloprotease [uncultured Tyzzerella sp.]